MNNPNHHPPPTTHHPAPNVVALAGGVGGAKLAHGLQMALPSGALSVVVNTGDDFSLWGLSISPDLDTVMYTLGGVSNREQGWGLEGDSWNGMEMMQRYGRDTWFRLGDRDVATHMLRTQMLAQGRTITEVTADLSASLDIPSRILPMCDEQIETMIRTPDGLLDFQQYFVAHRHADTVTGVEFKHSEMPTLTPQSAQAIAEAKAIVFCPSNPFVSIGPILWIQGGKDALARSNAPKVAVSPIIGGAAIKGPAAGMLQSLGHEVSAVGVAEIYRGVIDGMVIDTVDEALAPRIRSLGMEVEVMPTFMQNEEDRATLALSVLAFCNRLSQQRRGEGR